MKPYYQDDLVTIYHGNCMEILPSLPIVDLVVTSPPYNNWRNRRTQKNKDNYWKRTNIKYGVWNDSLSDNDYEKFQIDVINKCLAILNPKGTMCYNYKDHIFEFESVSPLKWIWKSSAIVRQRVTWDRLGMQAFNPVRFYRVEEDIYILGKERGGGFIWNREYAKYLSIWRISPSPKKEHPCSFPEEIPIRCIQSFSLEGMIVLDPFMGIGTTLVAAKKLNRRSIGIEIEERYCETASKQVAEIEHLFP